ncbi:hypothetical protein LSTR_LSTR003770 [Laodelphax striatellus]|uniref:Ketimine reductase mu-crystallin n=1 Tax=Laodelphax striatellus TaxID=195883 RepID=A0A482WQM3_LAOST|nr:hypothetical protein LSTR_LSTR003770 [Laodelphax striatellus]
MSSEQPLFMSDETVKSLLKWETLIPAVEGAMRDLSKKDVLQPPRLILPIPSKNGALLAMPAFSKSESALGCKVVTSFQNNQEKGLPSIMGTILFMDSETGKLKVIMEGTEITAWRTAAASVVATKHLHVGEKKILAILGAGTQGRIHALAMHHYFQFQEVRIWNRTESRAKALCNELGSWATHYSNKERCVRDADVIVTATYSPTPIVRLSWLKPGAHINAIGFGVKHHNELEDEIYKSESTVVWVDHMEAAQKELAELINNGVRMRGEVGQAMTLSHAQTQSSNITVFHSLGMAVEDVVAAKVVFEAHKEKLQAATRPSN